MNKKTKNSENKQTVDEQVKISKWKSFNSFLFEKRVLLLFIILAIFFTYLIGASFAPKEWIVAGGSTSVDPIMEQLTPWYKKKFNEDFIYNSMGSAAAPVGVANGYYDLGFESKSVKKSATEEPKEYETFTIAQDYFIILFHLPDGVTGVGKDNSVPLPSIEKTSNGTKELSKIMEDVYAGETWKQFSDDVQKIAGYKPFTDNSEIPDTKMTTFTRESGSGTRDYMEKNIIGYSGSTNNASVQSSNGGMFNAIDKAKGSMGYISFSYMSQIYKHLTVNSIVDDPAQVANGQLPYEIVSGDSNPVFNPNYTLKRPFVGLVRLNSPNIIASLEFINRILWTDNTDPTTYDYKHQIEINPISKIIYDLGFQPACYNTKSYDDTLPDNNDNIKKIMHNHDIDIAANPGF